MTFYSDENVATRYLDPKIFTENARCSFSLDSNESAYLPNMRLLFLGAVTDSSQDYNHLLGALALGAQRLLPVIQIIYQSWTSMKGGQAILEDALELIDQPLPAYANMQTSMALAATTNTENGFIHHPLLQLSLLQ